MRNQIPWNKKERPSKDFLIEEYINKHKSVDKIARELKVGETTLHRWFKEYNIPKRTSAESILPKNFKFPSKEDLKKWYYFDGLSVRDISKKLGISTPTVKNLLQKNNINTRTLSEQLTFGKRLPDKNTLQDLYFNKKMSLVEIGQQYGVSSGPIKKIFKEYGIKHKTAIRKNPTNYWTKEKVIEYIKKLHSKGERSLRSWDIRNNHTSVYHASYKLFGNWEKAVESAGINYKYLLKNPWKYNKQNTKEKLIELNRKGIDLSDSGLRKYDNKFYSAVTKRFGSIGNALKECGIDPHQYYKQKPTGYWTKERVIAETKRLIEQNEDLSSQNIRKKYSKLWNGSMKNFGGWINVLRKIGIKPDEISRLYANTKEFKKYLENELTKEKLEDLYYNQGFSELAIGEIYNCGYKPIQRLLKKNGLIPKKSKFGTNSKIICTDGHKVMSSYEMQVCEWLTRHKIKHDHDVKLNYRKYEGNIKIKVPKYRPDFMIVNAHKTYYIEVWGLAGIKEYDEKKKKKKELYKELKEKFGYELIEIYPKDRLVNKLGFLINGNEIKPTP